MMISDSYRELLRGAFEAAVSAANPDLVLPEFLPEPPSGRLLVLGAGKAARAMAAAVAGHYATHHPGLGASGPRGLVIVPPGHGPAEVIPGIEVAVGSHPLPDESSVAATERLIAAADACREDDHVLVLLSGGGSALLCAPDGITLEEKRELTRRLLRSGAAIDEINIVRKHLSRVKGGRLAQAAYPARLTALVLSDVVGDDLSSIASGPTVADPSTFEQALEVLDRYEIEAPSAREVLIAGARGERPETPESDDPRLSRARTVLVGNNQRSLEAAGARLAAAGYRPHLLSSTVTGDARQAASFHAAVARQIISHSQPFTAPCALVSGGETTVTVAGRGRGGRNGEFGLALALALPAEAPVHALIADSDGRDGSEENAGVLLSPQLLRKFDRLRARKLLGANDSYTFFQEHDHLFHSGPTGTNVNDLRVILVDDREQQRAR